MNNQMSERNKKTLLTATITPICIPLNEPERSKNFVNYTPFVAGELIEVSERKMEIKFNLFFRLG